MLVAEHFQICFLRFSVSLSILVLLLLGSLCIVALLDASLFLDLSPALAELERLELSYLDIDLAHRGRLVLVAKRIQHWRLLVHHLVNCALSCTVPYNIKMELAHLYDCLEESCLKMLVLGKEVVEVLKLPALEAAHQISLVLGQGFSVILLVSAASLL